MKNSNLDLKQPPARPDIQGDKTQFISLSDLKAKEEPSQQFVKVKSHKSKIIYTSIGVALALVMAVITIVVKNKPVQNANVEDGPIELARRSPASVESGDMPSQRQPDSFNQNYYQANPAYQDTAGSTTNYNQYPDEAERMPAYSEYDSEAAEAEPMPPSEEYQPPAEEYVE